MNKYTRNKDIKKFELSYDEIIHFIMFSVMSSFIWFKGIGGLVYEK